ncbi:MAG TPA: hypothetical protein VG273_05295 [Bryobacteraceae bacterium]|nr:hypothetical protein [Bryobacteraceae bacterium]
MPPLVHFEKSMGRRYAAACTMVGNASVMVILSAQALVLMPLYLHCIGARLLGAWLATGDVLVWLQAFDLGLPNLMIQRIGAAHGRNDNTAIGAWLASGLAVLSGIALCLAVAGFFVASAIPGWMRITGAEAVLLRSCFRVSAVGASLCVFNNGFVGFSRGIQDTGKMNGVMLISVIAAFLTAVSAATAGLGLWAPALAAAARALTLMVGGSLFVSPYLRGPLRGHFRIDGAVVRELFAILPATALGGIGYAAMNQSQIALAAVFLRPEAALVLSVTRKAADLLRSIADTIASSVYGSFASLAGSQERSRAFRVLHQLCALRSAVVIAGAAAYVAVNQVLVGKWVGPRQYGGLPLTMLIAVETVVVGGSYLFNYLYRATGPVARGSLMLLLEALMRVPLIIAGLKWLGLPGASLAATFTAAGFFFVGRRWTLHRLSREPAEGYSTPGAVWATRLFFCMLGIALGMRPPAASWSYVVVAALCVGALGLIALVLGDPRLNEPRRLALSMLRLGSAGRVKTTCALV